MSIRQFHQLVILPCLSRFLASDQGGRNFIVPHRVATSQSASAASSYWTKQAGLPTSGVTGWRRDAGNMVSDIQPSTLFFA